MLLRDFVNTLQQGEPPMGVSTLLEALWYDAKGNWVKAHGLAQSVHTARGAWVHAYLHRKEGDLANAAYWYARARKEVPMISLDEEWERICTILLSNF